MDKFGFKLSIFCTLFVCSLTWVGVDSLECYVCTEQEGNVEKCLATVRTCNSTQDTCLTEVRWGSTPYWSQGAEKQYYVTKRCESREACESKRADFIPYCHRIWYEDWKCAECCQGDRCNYYAFMGAGSVTVSWVTLGLSIILSTFVGLSLRSL